MSPRVPTRGLQGAYVERRGTGETRCGGCCTEVSWRAWPQRRHAPERDDRCLQRTVRCHTTGAPAPVLEGWVHTNLRVWGSRYGDTGSKMTFMSSESVSRFHRPLASRRRAVLTAALTAGLLVAGCSDSGGGAASTSSAASSGGLTSASSSLATTTQPPGTDAAAVQPVLQQLFDEQSRLLGVLGSKPASVNDPNNPDLIAFQQLFTADSPLLSGAIASFGRDASDGIVEQPGPSGVYHKSLLGPPLPGSTTDDVTFPVCTYTDYSKRVKTATGEVLSSEATIAPGTGEARRVQGIWRIVGFGPANASDVSHLPPGSPNTCVSATSQGTP